MSSAGSHKPTQPAGLVARTPRANDRREFLRTVGLGAAAACLPSLLAACAADSTMASSSTSSTPPTTPPAPPPKSSPPTIALDFSTDVGVLNFAYLLEQLAAAFYTQVKTTPPANMDSHELNVVQQIGVHETIHLSLLKTVLGSSAIGTATLSFASVNFTDRDSVLTTAKAFEDLDAGAYNGAAQFLQSATNLTLAAKIASVEARHAAAVRDLLAPETSAFAGSDVVDSNGFGQLSQPSAVLMALAPYIQNRITLTNVPTTA